MPNDKPVPDGRFMFAFAHDLRTHLRTVLTRIQLVQANAGGQLPEPDRAFLREAEVAVGDIQSLLSAGVAYCSAAPAENEIELSLLLQGVLLQRKAMLAEAGAEVEVANEVKGRVPGALDTVLKELVANACRFRASDRPLHIRIAARHVGASAGGIEIEVSDNGLGVDTAYLEKIFVPFQRLHARGEYPGNGLGLATCRRLVESWGGTIVAQTSAEGGLNVRVTAPLDP